MASSSFTLLVTLLAAAACAHQAHAASSVVLPGSTGGVPTTSVDVEGVSAFFTNDTAAVFAVDYATLAVKGVTQLDIELYGRPFFSFLSPAYPSIPYLYVFLHNSFLAAVDTTTMSFVEAVNLTDYIPSGWGGGYAVDANLNLVWLTGKYNFVAVSLGGFGASMQYQYTVPLNSAGADGGALFEPLCGDGIPLRSAAYFGSTVGGRTSGYGGLTAFELGPPEAADATSAPSQYFVPLGDQLYWPFGVIASADNAYVYAFASAGVGVVDVEARKVGRAPCCVCSASQHACVQHPECTRT